MKIIEKEFNRGNIYLSGGMQFSNNLGASWREIISAKLKAMKYFPLDITQLDISYAENHGKMQLIDSDPIKFKAYMRKHFIDTDLKLIKENSDAVIVYYDESARRGAGTVSEAQYAYNMNIPVFLVAEYETIEELHKNVSSWLIALSTAYFKSFEDLYEYLEKLPYGIIKKDQYGNHGTNGHYLCHLSGEVFVKNKSPFVSEIKPLYSQKSVNIVHDVYNLFKDRYEYFIEYYQSRKDL